ncbi:MAG TPA: hypothetical protein VHF47_06575 [Acidimicrobiales bacterium]|nr:hypothetical protein [Acidimicrobiales bacterium]
MTVRRLEAQATRRGVEIGQLLLEIITTAADSPLDEAVQAASGGR